MLRLLLSKLKPIFVFAREIFAYALLAYLLLFLFESLFTGFVSNSINMNWVLAAVMGLGLLSTLGPEAPEEKNEGVVKKSDYGLVIGLALIGGVIIFAKLELTGLVRWITAGVSGGLIALVGVVLLGKDEEKIDEVARVPQAEGSLEEPVAGARRPEWISYSRRMGRRFLTYHVRLPLVYVLAFVVITAFFVPQNVRWLAERLWSPAQPQPTATVLPQSPTPTPYFWDDYNKAENLSVDPKLPIAILNGGAEKGSAASASAILREGGYTQVEVGNAQRYDYTDVVMMFRTQDKAQASVIKQLLSSLYPKIIEAPAEATASGITIILGSQE